MMDQTHAGYDYWKQSNVYVLRRWLASDLGPTSRPECQQCKRRKRRSKVRQVR